MFIKRLFILLIVGSIGLNKSYADEVKCQEVPSEAEVFKLLSYVKNNVLGTIPKFCRIEGPAQLSDKIDDSEKELSDFVSALKVIDPSEKNVATLTEEEFEDAVLQTAKSIILKKMWAQFEESDKYNLLISNECSPLGLNRFKFYENSKKIAEKQKDEIRKSYQKTLKVCSSDKVEDLAPCFSKDVLAETLLNLRKIFPEYFSQMLISLCDGIKKTDEALLKNDEYKDFLISEIPVSAETFSAWLKTLYKKYNDNDGIIPTDYKNPNQGILYLQTKFDERQASLKLIYDAKGDETLLKNQYQAKTIAREMKLTGDTIEKNAKGYFIMKKGPGSNENEYKERRIEFEQKIGKIYDNAQAVEKPEKLVPFKNNSPILIFKDQNGKIQYEILEEDKINIIKEAKRLKNLKDKEQRASLKNPYNQALYKKSYDLQELLEGEEVEKTSVQKSPNGVYVKLDDAHEIDRRKSYEIFAEKYSGEIMPSIYDNTYYVKVGEAVVEVAYTKENQKELQKYWDEEKKEKGPMLSHVLRQTYQESSSDYENIKKNSPEKIAALSKYSSFGYQEINTCLRTESCSKNSQKRVSDIIEVMNTAKISGEGPKILFRGTRDMPPAIIESLKTNPKNFVLDKGFLSTSADFKVANGFSSESDGGFLFIIKAKSCIGIADVAINRSEDEFLCPPGMKFNVKKQSPNKNVYVLEEVSEK